jgi:hypothetical protein
MSAVPATKATPRVEERRRHRHRSRRPNPRPIQKPQDRMAERAKAKRRSIAMAQATTFAIIAGITFMASSLGGHVMVEKARREGLRAAERAREARKVEAVLRQKIDYMSSLSTVEAWATSHSFIAPDGLVQPAQAGQVTRVANND